ncbi:MAG: DUF460 domain-containing protein [Candidatus Micrarchaeaceae archaeon]
MHQAYIIVGIDPGKTIGLACVGLNGRLLCSSHMASAGEDWIIWSINEVGTPVIIASDKPARSALLGKVNAAFSSRLFYPQRLLKASEKRDIARGSGIKNVHERDAYVAALKAYNAYKSKFMRIDSSIGERSEEIKAKVIKKYSVSEALAGKKSGRR